MPEKEIRKCPFARPSFHFGWIRSKRPAFALDPAAACDGSAANTSKGAWTLDDIRPHWQALGEVIIQILEEN
jgi:hypothetical protein